MIGATEFAVESLGKWAMPVENPIYMNDHEDLSYAVEVNKSGAQPTPWVTRVKVFSAEAPDVILDEHAARTSFATYEEGRAAGKVIAKNSIDALRRWKADGNVVVHDGAEFDLLLLVSPLANGGFTFAIRQLPKIPGVTALLYNARNRYKTFDDAMQSGVYHRRMVAKGQVEAEAVSLVQQAE